MTTLRAQAAQFGFSFDTLGGDDDAEADAEADDRPHDRLRVRIGGEVAHERLIDLDLVERKASQIAQAGIAGAEIVHRYAHAKRTQRVQRGEHLAALFQQQGFGDFELEPLWRQAGLFQRIHHHRQQIAAAKLQRRQIDRDADIIGPVRRVHAGAAQHQPAERIDQAGLFGDGDEFGRRDHAALGMRPAHQRLEAGDAPGRKVDQWLIIRPQHVVLDRVAQIGLDFAAALGAGVHSGFEK